MANPTPAARTGDERAGVRSTVASQAWWTAPGWRLVLWGVPTAVFFGLTAAAIEHKITWYLAVDQFGSLVFARDLLHGRLFHEWAPARMLASLMPERADVLAQTYVWDHGILYSRYAPGFPLLLAVWTGLFGAPAAHLLNPILFLALLGVLVALEWRVHRSLWCGTAVVVLVMTCPSGVSLWALTPTRDVPAHFFAFLALTLLAGRGSLGVRRELAAGLALGFAASIRPDSVLYLVPAGILAAAHWRRAPGGLARAGGAALLGLLIGLAPSFVYYGAATGNPFVPTQSMEVSEFLGAPEQPPVDAQPDGKIGFPPAAWRGTTLEPVSGGGLKLEHLPTTLPGNWQKIRNAYGDVLLGVAAAGLIAALILRPAFGAAIGAYMVVALLVYSCWARPYGRYLIGIWLLVPVLIVEALVGGLALLRRLAQGRTELARWIAIAAAGVLVGSDLPAGAAAADATALVPLTHVIALGGALALAATAVWPRRRIATVAVPVLTLALVGFGCTRLSATLATRAPFQRAQVERATAIVRQTLVPPALVITAEDAGRPMENLEYYADVRAFYLTDLARWQVPIYQAVFEAMVSEMEPYLLIPRALPERDHLLDMLRGTFLVELVQEIPPERAADFFVMAPQAVGPLELWHIR
ncbi:MAG TPA: hypothetical protein VKU61_11535 [Candidatus Binatia bacterium]|nr:hypothetical protein [Candidatus Binatia bacterium]